MRLLVIDSQSGAEQTYEIHRRAITFDFDTKGALRPMVSASAIRIEDNGRNVLITDLGLEVPVRLGNLHLAPQMPMVWLAHQEVRLEQYILFWQPTRTGWRQRLSTWTADRVSLMVILWLLGLLLFALALLGLYSWRQQQAVLQNATVLSTWFPPYAGSLPLIATALPTATATATAPTATATLTPTQVLTTEPAYIKPTATPTATLTVSVTRLVTDTAIGGAGVLSVAITHTMTPESWDPRLTELGVAVLPAVVPIGAPFWRLLEARWLNEAEANGLHHVFIDVVGEDNLRILQPPPTVRMLWTTGVCERVLDNNAPYWVGDRSYGANCPMYNAGNVYQLKVDGLPSDVVQNIGLGTPGEQRTWDIRTSFLFVFQRTIHRKAEE